MLKFFNTKWSEVPTVWIDTETTGVRPGRDRAVQIGLAKFEDGELVDGGGSLINPGIPIPPEATAIHGITDEMVRGAPTIEQFFETKETRDWLAGDFQLAAYNAPFDRNFIPPIGEDWTWPWLDALSLVRVIDRFERGKGRHRLEIACARHGVRLAKAHSAEHDAAAAGVLFYRLMQKFPPTPGLIHPNAGLTLGQLLKWQREQEAGEWFRFSDWLSRQPPRPEVSP